MRAATFLRRVVVVGAIALACRALPLFAAESSKPLRVLTSFLPIHSAASAVGGSRASVENWLPAGVDPHDFQFSPRDLRRLRDADMLIVAGLGLENWTEEQLRRISGNERLRLVRAADGVPEAELIHGEEAHDHDHDHDHDQDHGHGEGAKGHAHEGGPNPHFWLDPLLFAKAAQHIAKAMSEADPAGAAQYAENAERYAGRLEALHREYEEGLGKLKDVPFLTYHNAFPYLARRYGLKLAGVVEATAAEQPSARELVAISETSRAAGAKVLFTDGNRTRLARRLAADLGLRLADLDTLETGTPKPGAYEEGMRRNLKSLREALGSDRRP
jgi:zinc transport system substrate-binding protein